MTAWSLFPLPSRPEPVWGQTPHPFPGVTAESSETLTELMNQNSERFHIYFNDKGYHNHLTHHLLAAWSLGAPKAILEEIFEEHASYQRPKVEPPESITDDNWTKHLGLRNEKYYQAYHDFYAAKISEPGGISRALEDFIFSEEANHGSGGRRPMMLGRFFSGVLHPAIHSGHIEFGMPGMLAEGLAQASVTSLSNAVIFPEEFFSDPDLEHANVQEQLASLSIPARENAPKIRSHIASIKPVHSHGLHSLTIVANMLADKRLAPSTIHQFDTDEPLATTLKDVGEVIREYSRLWLVPADGNSTVLRSKIEELQWLATIIFGLGGWREGHKFRSDFFLMHLLTSSIFLPSLAAYLSPSSQSALLRGHLSVMLAYWVSRGRPALPVKPFFASVSATPSPPGPKPTPSKDALGKGKSLEEIDNPWFGIVQSVLQHPDEHLVKTIRALEHYARIYGTKDEGTFGDTGLEGAEALDGTLFVRVAGNAIAAQGWVREGEEYPGDYDRAGLVWDDK